MPLDHLNTIEPMSQEDYDAWNERNLVKEFTGFDMAKVEEMQRCHKNDYALWLHRAVAYFKKQQQLQMEAQAEALRRHQAAQQAAQEEAAIRQQLAGKSPLQIVRH